MRERPSSPLPVWTWGVALVAAMAAVFALWLIVRETDGGRAPSAPSLEHTRRSLTQTR